MLVALFVRHYKIFKNINFIPVTSGTHFTSYFGTNGIGKTSILDALDKAFNGGQWNINIQAKREGGITSADKVPFIAPVFVIPKTDLSGLSAANAETLSDHLWNVPSSSVPGIREFVEFRERLRGTFNQDDHFLLCLGKTNNDNKLVTIGPFNVGKVFSDPHAPETVQALQDLHKSVFALYTFVNVPVEINADEFTRLESKEMAKLLDDDIQNEIEKAITLTSVRTINEKLGAFLDEIHEHMESYRYKGTHKENLTRADLVTKVFEAFFSIRMLNYVDGNISKPITSLSSGEKRKALVDVAYSFLTRRRKRSSRIILAIDEPDASLHVTACHDQFQRLSELCSLTDPSTQVITTTHWYGFLPILADGTAHSMTATEDDRIKFDSFDLYHYQEEIRQNYKNSKGQLPSDVRLKSYNDLTQSIVSSVARETPFNWILCEGLSDKIYLEHYLKTESASLKLRILPLGGFKEVRKVYDYLTAPLNDRDFEIHGKILCLVDTDKQFVDYEPLEIRGAAFKRLTSDAGVCKLLPYKDQLKVPTEIEDCLSPEPFDFTLKWMVSEFYSDEEALISLSQDNPLVPHATTARDALNLRTTDAQLLTDFFDRDDNKVRFARHYVEYSDVLELGRPTWVNEIVEYFSPPSARTKRAVK